MKVAIMAPCLNMIGNIKIKERDVGLSLTDQLNESKVSNQIDVLKLPTVCIVGAG